MQRTSARRLLSLLSLLAMLAVLALYGRHVLRTYGAFTVDDAAISFAYANNVAEGRGFRLTPNTNPVEGFSNPLEVLLLVPCRWVGADLGLSAKVLNVGAVVLAALLAGLLVWWNLDGPSRLWVPVACAFGFLWPTFNHWTAAGLEGGLLCSLQMASVLLLVVSPKHAWRDAALAAVAVLLVLVRPEAIVYGALAVAGRMLIPSRRWRSAGLFALGCLTVFLVRFALFRQWLPNTYYAKMHAYVSLRQGWDYLRTFFSSYGLAYFLCGWPLFAFSTARTRLPALVATAQMVFALTFVTVTGGDWMRHWRFLQPLQGPYWMLCLLGLLALLSLRPRRSDARLASARSTLLVLSLFPPVFFGLHGWEQRVQLCSTEHDVDMSKVAKVGALYRGLGDRLNLGRPLLVADVDVGGMSYPPGIDILDMGGLADLTFGHSWSRRPTEIVDYFFDYRSPHTMHVHGGWVEARPLHSLSPFARDYRVMGQRLMNELAVSWLTAIRADLVDPAMAPVLPVQARVGAVQLLGFSSLADTQGNQVLFVHAWQVENADPPALTVTRSDVEPFPVGWHAQQDVARGPAGTPLLGMVRLPPEAMPITVGPAGLRLDTWPTVEPGAKSLEDLSRLRLFRPAGLLLQACHPDDFLTLYATAGARARGARLLADLCGGGFSRPARAALAEDIARHASSLPAGEDRYDACRIFESLGLPTSTLQMGKVERARQAHAPYDEIAAAWSDRLLRTASPTPAQVRAGLAALVLARQYDKAILTGLARGFVGLPEAREPLCVAMKALALQPYLLSQLSCPDAEPSRLRLARQDFENPSDPGLHFDQAARGWFVSQPTPPRVGGQGKTMLSVPPCATDRCPELVWGPLPWRGRYFGALVAGSRWGGVVLVEAPQGIRWVEIGRIEGAASEGILAPGLVELRATFPSEVRVRVKNGSRSRPMTVDALTFLDLD
jgi:hypothetical protein